MPKIPNRTKLLLYLNPDIALFEDVARHVYGRVDEYTVENVKSAARNAALTGWDIFIVTNIRTQEKGFTLSEDHYKIIDNNREIVKKWQGRRMVTPGAVERAVK